MATVINFPDFLVDPVFDAVGVSLGYDGSMGIGGSFGEVPSDRYVKTLAEALASSTPFKLASTVLITKLKQGVGIVIGAIDPVTGSLTYIQLHSSTADDVIDTITVVMDDGPSAVAKIVHAITAIDTLVTTIIRIEWTYDIVSGFPTTRVVLRDATDAILADVSNNLAVTYSVTDVGILTPPDAVAEGAPNTDAILTSLVMDTVLPITGTEVSVRMVQQELGSIVEQESSAFHKLLSNETIPRWIQEEDDNLVEFLGLENRADFDAMVNTIAEQLVRRQSQFRQVVLFRVCARILGYLDGNRAAEPLGLSQYAMEMKDFRRRANRLSIRLSLLFHPGSQAESQIVDKPMASTYPLQPHDPVP